MADAREIELSKSTAVRLQLRDVERAFAFPRPNDALVPESIVQHLRDLRIRQPAPMTAFEEALASLTAIDEWCGEQLADNRPDLAPLMKLLEPLRSPVTDDVEAVAHVEPLAAVASMEDTGPCAAVADESAVVVCADQGETQHPGTVAEDIISPSSSAPAVPQALLDDRQSALASIRAARIWFEAHEPSSPCILVLLKRAEAFVGKRYSEVVKAIPAELLAEWDA